MTGIPDTLLQAPPSPVARGGTIANRWTVGPRLALRGDLHVHEGAGEVDVRIVAWRYRGSEPLPRFLQHLSEDAMAWGALRHGHLVPTLDCGRITGQTTCFWITEDPGGPVLADRLAEHPVLAPDLALQHALQVGQGVLAAHLVGLVHGDLDPANVHLVGPKDRARLAWGGLATRVEYAGMDAGRGTTRSLAEVAPEVLQGALPTRASDLYALAALLFRMLAGQPPFLVRRDGPPPGLLPGEPLPPLPEWVSPKVAEALALGLARDPDRRPADLGELLDRLAEAERDARGLPVPPGAWAPAPSSAGTTSPPTLHRTLSPAPGREDGPLRVEDDPALANTPPASVSRAPDPATGLRSIVPVQPRMDPPRPRPTPTPTPAPPRPPSLVGPAAVIALAVLAGFALVALAVASFTDRAPAPVAAPAPPPVAAAPAPPPAPAPAAVLTLRTDPPGAEVWEGGAPLGRTPLEVVLEGGPADPPRAFELRLEGYATHTVRQPWSATAVEHVVPLQRLPAPRPRPPAPSIKERR